MSALPIRRRSEDGGADPRRRSRRASVTDDRTNIRLRGIAQGGPAMSKLRRFEDIVIRPEGIRQERTLGHDSLTLIFPFSGNASPEWQRRFQVARLARPSQARPTTVWGDALRVHHVENDPQRMREATEAVREDGQSANEAYRDTLREDDAVSAEARRRDEEYNARAQDAIEQIQHDWVQGRR
jgi:hypothetical protein